MLLITIVEQSKKNVNIVFYIYKYFSPKYETKWFEIIYRDFDFWLGVQMNPFIRFFLTLYSNRNSKSWKLIFGYGQNFVIRHDPDLYIWKRLL